MKEDINSPSSVTFRTVLYNVAASNAGLLKTANCDTEYYALRGSTVLMMAVTFVRRRMSNVK